MSHRFTPADLKVRLYVIVSMMMFAVVSAGGHHSPAAYGDTLVEFKNATITKFLWSNPHSLIYFDVKDAAGTVTNWVVETGSPSSIVRVGWSKTSLQAGDLVTMFAYPAKSGKPAGRLNRVVLPDGSTLRDTQLGGDGVKQRYEPEADKP